MSFLIMVVCVPSLNTFYQIVTLLDISVDQFFYPDRQNSESDCR